MYNELIAAEVLSKFRHEHDWLARIPSADKYVNNNAINLIDIGADPEVLIDNKIYPIPTMDREDDTIIVALKKFDTVNTRITKDETYALAYDKEGSVLRQHRESLEESTSEYGLYSMCPSANTTETPVITTTGADDGTGRKRMTIADLVTMKLRFDKLKIPKKNRIAVLSSQHIADLLLVSESFQNQYQNNTTGTLKNLYSFDIYESVYNPTFTGVNKNAWGADAAGTDKDASVFMYTPRAFKAKGTVEPFTRKAENDPENRESVFGLRIWQRAMPKKNEGFGAIVSAAA